MLISQAIGGAWRGRSMPFLVEGQLQSIDNLTVGPGHGFLLLGGAIFKKQCYQNRYYFSPDLFGEELLRQVAIELLDNSF